MEMMILNKSFALLTYNDLTKMQVMIEWSKIDDKDIFPVFLYCKIMQFIYAS